MVKLTSELSDMKNPNKKWSPKGSLNSPPYGFNGAANGDSVKKLIASLKNYFDLMIFSNPK